jgi:hypothetical protein
MISCLPASLYQKICDGPFAVAIFVQCIRLGNHERAWRHRNGSDQRRPHIDDVRAACAAILNTRMCIGICAPEWNPAEIGEGAGIFDNPLGRVAAQRISMIQRQVEWTGALRAGRILQKLAAKPRKKVIVVSKPTKPLIECPMCKAQVGKRKLDSHMKERCPKRNTAPRATGNQKSPSAATKAGLPAPSSDAKRQSGSPSLKTVPGLGKGAGLLRTRDRDRAVFKSAVQSYCYFFSDTQRLKSGRGEYFEIKCMTARSTMNWAGVVYVGDSGIPTL